tara:strand:+ start:237 stop:494 length:258 start_codon:yes stop_codon:yes gene_type:complete
MVIEIVKEQIHVNGSKFLIDFSYEQGELIKRTPKTDISITIVNPSNNKKIELELIELLKTSYDKPIYSVWFKSFSILELIENYLK